MTTINTATNSKEAFELGEIFHSLRAEHNVAAVVAQMERPYIKVPIIVGEK